MTSAVANVDRVPVVRQSFKPILAVRSTAVSVVRAFDALCALTVMLVTFTSLNTGRLPAEMQELLTTRLSVKNFAVAVLVVVIWHFSFAAFGLYQARLVRSFSAAARRIVLACSVAALFVSPLTTASNSGTIGPHLIPLFWLVAVVAELAGRALIAAGAQGLEQRARPVRVAVIVGSGRRALGLWRTLEARAPREYEIAGFVDSRDRGDMVPEIRPRYLGAIEHLEALLARRPVDEVLIALPVKSQYSAIEETLSICERVGVEAQYFPDFFTASRARHEIDADGVEPSVRVQHVASDQRLLVKRAVDVVGAAVGLVLLTPVLLACAIAVRASGPGPVFFSQSRYGYNRRQFRMFKFRTMVEDAEALQASLEGQNEAEGPVFKIQADPRITAVGRVLRRTSLDELPQLFNVLRGEMSLVGPRPLAVRDVLRFDETRLMRRFSVPPGLTCLWQVTGRSNTSFDEWMRLDLDYIDNWSLALDLRILIRTVPAVLSGSGAV